VCPAESSCQARSHTQFAGQQGHLPGVGGQGRRAIRTPRPGRKVVVVGLWAATAATLSASARRTPQWSTAAHTCEGALTSRLSSEVHLGSHRAGAPWPADLVPAQRPGSGRLDYSACVTRPVIRTALVAVLLAGAVVVLGASAPALAGTAAARTPANCSATCVASPVRCPGCALMAPSGGQVHHMACQIKDSCPDHGPTPNCCSSLGQALCVGPSTSLTTAPTAGRHDPSELDTALDPGRPGALERPPQVD